jgi:hypothetical protein
MFYCVVFEVVIASAVKHPLFWDITPYSLVKVKNLTAASFLLTLFFDPEDGCNIFLRKVADFRLTTRSYIQEDRTNKKKQIPWPLVRKRTVPTELPPLVGEVSANFSG